MPLISGHEQSFSLWTDKSTEVTEHCALTSQFPSSHVGITCCLFAVTIFVVSMDLIALFEQAQVHRNMVI